METSGGLFVIITGIAVIALSSVLDRIWIAAVPVRMVYLVIRLPGVVLHECAHITGCLMTGARIQKVVLFSPDGGSVTHSRPALPYIGDVIISTAPLFLLPLALSFISWTFMTCCGCVFPAFPAALESPYVLFDLMKAVVNTISDNLFLRFNGWFLLYLYLTVSIVLSVAPSPQDMKNAAAGMILMTLATVLAAMSGIPLALTVLAELISLIGYGFMLGLVYGLLALAITLPLVIWNVSVHRS